MGSDLPPAVNVENFKKEDGSTDWAAYREARINNGEECYYCNSCIVWTKGYRSLCNDCKDMKESWDEVMHSDLIRCPFCWMTNSLEAYDYPGMGRNGGEGEHKVCCPDCGKDFQISLSISYTFTSPPKEKTEEPERDEE